MCPDRCTRTYFKGEGVANTTKAKTGQEGCKNNGRDVKMEEM